jgi:hypothetical protein
MTPPGTSVISDIQRFRQPSQGLPRSLLTAVTRGGKKAGRAGRPRGPGKVAPAFLISDILDIERSIAACRGLSFFRSGRLGG